MNTMNYLLYYFNLATTWLQYYIGYIYYQFMEFAFVIKLAAIGVTVCIIILLFTILRLLVSSWKRRKMTRIYNRLNERYGQAINYMLSPAAPEMMSTREILKELDLSYDDIQGQDVLRDYNERLNMSRLIYRAVISEEAALDRNTNLHRLIRIFRIQEFLENMVHKDKMSHKTEALLMLRAFKLPVNPWVANRLVNSKRIRVRRLAMYASIMAGSNKDLEYFESDFFDNNCCLYDEIQLGYVLQRRIACRRKIPNLALLALHQKNAPTQSVFVRLMRLFDQRENCNELEEMFQQNADSELIEEIARTWGYLDYKESEDLMNQVIITQNDDVKITIMHALARLGTGHSLRTFTDNYMNSSDQKVRYESLRCLWNYGKEGRAEFKILEAQAQGEEKRLFDFFHNDITKDDIMLSRSSLYHQRFGDNIYSVA